VIFRQLKNYFYGWFLNWVTITNFPLTFFKQTVWCCAGTSINANLYVLALQKGSPLALWHWNGSISIRLFTEETDFFCNRWVI